MSIIYKPGGHAGRQVPWAANLYKGCVHGCSYCYAPFSTFTDKADFHAEATVRKDVLLQMERELRRGIVPSRTRIMLSLSSDPYQPIALETGTTRKAIELIHEYFCYVRIMTKAGYTGDLDILGASDHYGNSLTFLSEEDTKREEPCTAMPRQRIRAILMAKAAGIYTDVNLEPVIDPSQTVTIIAITHQFVDRYVVGPKGNMTPAKREMLEPVVRALEGVHANYHIAE